MYPTILRAAHVSNFTIISNDPRKKALSGNTYKIFALLLEKPDNWKVIPKAVAKDARLSLYAVKKSLRELQEKGFVVLRQIRDSLGRWANSLYVIKENPDLPNPHELEVYSVSRNPASGESDGGFSTHIIITKESNTEITNNPSTSNTPLTGVCDNPEVFETSFSEQNSEPEPCLDVIPSPMTVMNSTSTNNPSGEEHLPAAITIVTNVANVPDCDLSSTARFDRQIRTYQNVEVLTANLVEIYNRIKPEHWGKCTTIGFHLPRQVASILRCYEDGDLLIQEWGEACLALKANDFYNSPKFKNGNINFLLDPTKTERIPQLAQAWRDRPQVQKEQIAKQMVAASKGIPTWGNPDVELKGMLLHFAKKEYARYIDNNNLDHPDCPSLDYLKTYFGSLFKNV